MYVSYEYYCDTYGGSLSEEAFKAAERRAEAEIRAMTYINGNIFATEADAVKDAVCAAAEMIAKDSEAKAASGGSMAGTAGIRSESNDGYSVTYISDAKEGQTAAAALRKRIADAVRAYLLPTGWLSRRVPCSCRGTCHRDCHTPEGRL